MSGNSYVLASANWGTPLAHARAFMAEHGEAVRETARILGGDAAAHRFQALAGALREARSLTRSLRIELVRLHRLLSGDADAVEGALEPIFDADDPVVHDFCRLADRLYDVLCAVARDGGAAPEIAGYLDRFAA